MPRKSPYKHISRIDWIGDMIGARVADDQLAVAIENQDEPLDVSAEPVRARAGWADEEYLDTVVDDEGDQFTLHGLGATEIVGRFDTDEEIEIEVEWLDDEYNVLFTDHVETSGGTFDVEIDVLSPHPRIQLAAIDTAAEVTGILHMR